MFNPKPIHPDFHYYLNLKDQPLIDLYQDVRSFVWSMYPEANELIYHTHALTSVYSLSKRLSDAFCMIPIYSNHLNLGFHKGILLNDPHGLLQGTGKLIRHIPVQDRADYRNEKVEALVRSAIQYALDDMDKPSKTFGTILSKIKK